MIEQMTRVRIECEALPPESELLELEGSEALSRGFDFDVVVATRAPDGPAAEEIVGAQVSLVFESSTPPIDSPSSLFDVQGWHEIRRIDGLICECDDVVTSREDSSYRLRIVPGFWQSTLIETLDIFMDLSLPDILRKKLTMFQMAEGQDFELRLDAASYPSLEFVVQYKETDHAFLSRLCEHHGVFYFHEQRGEREVLVFADDNTACRTEGELEKVHFRGRGEQLGVYELHTKARLTPKVFVQRDYNYRTPQSDLTAMADNDVGFAGGVVEYGAHFRDAEQGQRIATVRAQERKCERQVLYGKSTLGSFGAGRSYQLVGHPRGDRALLLTQVLHHARQGGFSSSGGEPDGYHNEFLAIPIDIPFRPARITPRPRVGGVLTGIIDGTTVGQYAEVDDQGRYRVKFMFDTSGAGEGKASSVVRMMQPHSGAGYGMHFPLRVGTEVLITFFDGDPDRPIIAGTVPNPATPSPVRSDNATHNVIRTGGGNEIDINDDEGNERVKITSPFGKSVVQIGQSNEAENGIALGTMNNITSSADGAVSALSTVQTNWNSFNDTWSCHIIGYAGPTTPLARLSWGIDAFKGVAVMVGDVSGGILTIRDNIVARKKARLESVEAGHELLSDQREADRAALLACLATVKQDGLDAERRAKLAAVGPAVDDVDSELAGLGAKAALVAELQAEKAELEAALASARRYDGTSQAALDAQQAAIDAKQAEITTAEADEATAELAVATKQATLAAKLAAIAEDPVLAALGCGGATLAAKATALSTSNSATEAARLQAQTLAAEIADGEASLAGAQETKDWADGLVTAVDSITSPLFSLVSTIWGTGMGGLARNVADFMLEEALAQDIGAAFFPTYIPTPKMQFDIKSPPLFMKLVPPELKDRPVEAYQTIARLDWATPMREATQMVPGGGGGMLGAGKTAMLALIPVVGPFLAFRYSSTQNGAYQEARNIQGSEAHAALFGQTSAFVSGQEHAALTSAKKVVVTANDQVEIHSRGETEVAGGKAVYVTSSDNVEVVSRGKVLVKATGPSDMSSANTAAARFLSDIRADKDRAKLAMERGKITLGALKKDGSAMHAQLDMEVADATGLGKLKLHTGAGNQYVELAEDSAATSNAITVVTPGTFELKAEHSVLAKNEKWTLSMDQNSTNLGNDESYVELTPTLANIGCDEDNFAEFKPAGAVIGGAKIDLETSGNLTLKGSKILLG